MKKSPSALILLTLLFPILTMTLFGISAPIVKASPSTSSFDVEVDHEVQIRDGGLIVINDTLKLVAKPGQVVENLRNFTLGFPFRYKFDLEYVYAYPTSNPNSLLTVELDTGLGKIGFYGVNVIFSNGGVNISNGGEYEFTVVFVFSNRISFQAAVETGETLFNATFPAYPSLTLSARTANLTISFPIGAKYTTSSFEMQGIEFGNATEGSFQVFNYPQRSNLTEFMDEQAWFSFSAPSDVFKIIEASEVKREIQLDGYGQILISDSYHIISRSDNVTQIGIRLPSGAYEVTAWDTWGQIPSDRLSIADNNVTLTFSPALSQGQEEMFAVNYLLPWKDCVNAQTWSSFYVNLSLFENYECIIRKLTTTVTLPEGAILLSQPQSTNLNGMEQNGYQTTLTFVFNNATPFHSLAFDFVYGYTIFWESFRPTIWISAIVTFVTSITVLWRVSKPAVPVPTVPIYPKELRSFVDAYEEKRKATLELESIERQVRRGKIPRRQYKVRRRTLESRISVLSRDLATLKEKIRTAGPRYSDMMRQIEVAETALEGVEADIRRTEIRYRRGEISASAYRNLLEDSYKRRDRAKTTIDGVLLRLKEEIS